MYGYSDQPPTHISLLSQWDIAGAMPTEASARMAITQIAFANSVWNARLLAASVGFQVRTLAVVIALQDLPDEYKEHIERILRSCGGTIETPHSSVVSVLIQHAAEDAADNTRVVFDADTGEILESFKRPQ